MRRTGRCPFNQHGSPGSSARYRPSKSVPIGTDTPPVSRPEIGFVDIDAVAILTGGPGVSPITRTKDAFQRNMLSVELFAVRGEKVVAVDIQAFDITIMPAIGNPELPGMAGRVKIA